MCTLLLRAAAQFERKGCNYLRALEEDEERIVIDGPIEQQHRPREANQIFGSLKAKQSQERQHHDQSVASLSRSG